MVADQLEARGIRDPRVLAAMGTVPREAFTDADDRRRAYEDAPIHIGWGQTISQPYMVALICEAAAVGPDDRVLDVGTGSGYQAAVLAELAREVHTIERIEQLVDRAREKLAAAGYERVVVHQGDGSLGLPELAPFDAVTVAAAAPGLPAALYEQLAWGEGSSSRSETGAASGSRSSSRARRARRSSTPSPVASCRSSARRATNLSAMAKGAEATSSRATVFTGAASSALRRPGNWLQLAKFCTVGASGYVVNLAVYASLLAAGVHYLPGRGVLVPRRRHQQLRLEPRLDVPPSARPPRLPGSPVPRSSRRSPSAANLAFLSALVALGVAKLPAQAIAIVLVTPWNFVANKLWSFRRRPRSS